MESKELFFTAKSNGVSKKEKYMVILWDVVYFLFFKHSLPFMSSWRVFLLRLFGAQIGRECYISSKAVFYRPWNIEIGSKTSIDDYCFLRATGKIILGDYVSLAMYVHIVPGGHEVRSRSFESNATFVKIGNGCFIGADAFVGRGVTIGQFSVLGARSVAYKDIPENCIAIGCPAKVHSERIPMEEYQKYRYTYESNS